MTNDQIKEIALANGHQFFVNPDGTKDIHPLAYQFARALIEEYLETHDIFELGAQPRGLTDD